jgi:hypothetical protein
LYSIDTSTNEEAAVHKVERAANELSTVTANVHMIADWWSDMDTALAGLLVRSEGMHLGMNGPSKLKVKSIQRSWINVNKDYMRYKREVCTLMNCLRHLL